MKHKRIKLGRKEQSRTEEERNFEKMEKGVNEGGRKARKNEEDFRQRRKKKK